MAPNPLKRSLWMMNQLISSGTTGITREELSRKWSDSKFNDKKETELPERTFFRIRKSLEELFEVEIISRTVGGVNYYSVEQTDYSVFLGMLCGLVSDNSKRNLSLKDLMLQVMNDVEITEEEKRMLDDISFKIGKESYECGRWLIDEALEGRIKGADSAQWSEYRKYHLCIWLEEEYQRLKSWVGVYLNRNAGDGKGEACFYIVCESQNKNLHALLMQKLQLLPSEKQEEDYWWFAPKDETLRKINYVSRPDRHAIRARVEILLARLNPILV